MRRGLELLLAAVLAAAAVYIAVPAQAGNTGSCPARNSCFWTGTSYTGTRYAVLNSAFRNQWGNMPARGSAAEEGNSALELWDAQTGAHVCILIARGIPDARQYGHFYIAYGAGSCSGIPPFTAARPVVLTAAASPARFRKFVCIEKFHSLVLSHVTEHGVHMEIAAGHFTESCAAELRVEAAVLRLQIWNPKARKWDAAAPADRWGAHPGVKSVVIRGTCFRNTRERMWIYVAGVTQQGRAGTYSKKWPFFGLGMRTVNCDRRYPAS